MAGIGKRRLEEALEEVLGSKQDVARQVPAALGAYINGQKTIVVNGQPDYVWCRIRGNTSERVKAFNADPGVGHHWDLPIILVRDPNFPDVWKVKGRDLRRYRDWGKSGNLPQSSPYLPPHGSDHSFSGQAGMGADPVWVFKRQMMPLLPHPQPTGSMAIEIGSDFYYFGGQYRWFASTGTPGLESFLPTGGTNGRFVTVYIDGASGNPALLVGEEINAVTPPIDPGDYIPIPSTGQGIPVAAVFLLTGTTRIGWGEIYDLRHPHTSVPVGAGANRMVVGQPTSLGDGATGVYWIVPDGEYYTGSLALALGGVVQTPSIDYQEQFPGSGTFEFLTERPPTGSVQTVWYGVET
jgi:hypothetical protein